MKFPILDLETTGLDIKPGAIMEVSVVIMDTSFKVLEEYSKPVMHAPRQLEPLLNEWARNQHRKSGLLNDCYNRAYRLWKIEEEVCYLMDKHFGVERPILVGSSIHWDRRWIAEYMPRLDARLHYRMMDVSGLWEWLRLFHSIERPKMPEPDHRGTPDTRGSARLLEEFGSRVVVYEHPHK